MEKDWVMVYAAPGRERAFILQTALEDAGIRVVILDKTSTVYGFAAAGQVELYVHVSEAEAALEVIYRLDHL